MENSQLISISSSYPIPVYIILPIITIYCGIYLNLSNHYVLRPKIQSFLQKVSFSSTIGVQVLLDVLSNLSFITYAVSAFILTPPADHPFRILQYYNSYWLTICLAIVVYMKIPEDSGISKIVFCKNGIILGLCYVNVLYHYIDGNKLITLPAILIGLYAINLLVNSYEQKFIQVVLELLNMKEPTCFKPKTKMISHLPTVELLAKDFPITTKQLQNHLQAKKKRLEDNQNFDEVKNRRKIKTKIDTKLIAHQKLLQICTCVHLSMLKRQQQQKAALKQYVGFMNGTISDGKYLTKNTSKIGVRHRKTYLNNRNKDKLSIKKLTKRIKQSCVVQNQKIGRDINKIESMKQQNNNKSYLSQKDVIQENQQRIPSNLESESILFYLFPVKIFESSKIISVLFAFFLNLAVGVLFNYSHNVIITLPYGRFADFVLSALFIPILPAVSPIQFTNTMALSSILKFGICGLFACISVGINSQNQFIQWEMTPYVQYNTIVQIVVLFLGFGVVISGKRFYKLLVIIFLIMLGINSMICYFSLSSQNG